MPLIRVSLDQLSGIWYFTKLDIHNAYYRMRIKDGDKWKTAFRTHYRYFEFTVISFGLADAPTAFHCYINQVLRNCLDIYCIAYLDNIVDCSITLEKHH